MNTTDNPAIHKKPKRRKWMIILGSIVILLIIVRLIMPFVVLKFVNKKLSTLKEYRGHVEDIDLALIRGAYQINDLRLDKIDTLTNKADSIPFFTCSQIDLSVQWAAIFKGAIVGEIYVENPVLNFVKGKHKNEDAKADTADFQSVIRDLMPLTINHFEINNGQVHFVDPYSSPVIDVPVKNIEVKADNLSNANDSSKVLPASLRADATVYGGTVDLDVKFNALEKQPTFDLNANIKNVNMVNLNDFFKAYGKFTVNKGSFGLYAEFAAKGGAFKGYVKPLIRDLDVAQEGNFAQIVWSDIVEGAAWVFKNHSKDQVATKLPVEGRFDDPNASLWTAISYVLKNAFVFALRPSVDNTIDIGKVEPEHEKKTFLQKIFGKKDKKEGDGKPKDKEPKSKHHQSKNK